jgi:hypothetical protein
MSSHRMWSMASVMGLGVAIVTAIVFASEPTVQFVFVPTNIYGGAQVTGTIIFTPAYQQAVQIKLASSNPALAQVPPAIQIPAGQTQGTFNISTFPVPSATNVGISAWFPGELAKISKGPACRC